MATEDLVQVTLMRVLRRVEAFDSRHPGAFMAYLRQTLLNQMRNEIRRATRRPAGEPISEEHVDPNASVLEQYIGRQALEAYEAALAQLSRDQRAAVIMRIELGMKHSEIAGAIGSASPNAARMLVSRALVKLAELMSEAGLDSLTARRRSRF